MTGSQTNVSAGMQQKYKAAGDLFSLLNQRKMARRQQRSLLDGPETNLETSVIDHGLDDSIDRIEQDPYNHDDASSNVYQTSVRVSLPSINSSSGREKERSLPPIKKS